MNRRPVARRLRLRFWFRALALACGASATAAEGYSTGLERPAADGLALGPGSYVVRELSTDGRDSFALSTGAGDFIRLRVDSTGIDVGVTIATPRGATAAEAVYRRQGPKHLCLVAAMDGEYRVEIRALETAPVTGRYGLRVTDLRESEPSDLQRARARELFNEAEALRAQWTAESSREALTRYQAALRHWEDIGDRAAKSATLTRLGEVYQALGRLSLARARYLDARACAEEQGDLHAGIHARNGLSQVDLLLGDTEAALRHARSASRLSGQVGDLASEAVALNNMGDVYWLLGRMRESLSVYSDALAAAERVGSRRSRARALRNLGFSHSDLSEVELALDFYDRAISLSAELEDRHGQAVTLNGLGHLYSKVGEKQKALGRYLRARDLFESMGEPIGAGTTASGMGFVYVELGEEEVALGYYEEQLRLHRSAPFPEGEAGALIQIGRCHYALGDFQKALDHLRQAFVILESAQNRMLDTYASGLLGLTYEAMGESSKALESFERSLAVSRQIGDRREESYALSGSARILHRLGHAGEALGRLRQARGLSAGSRDRVGEALSLYYMAVIERERNSLEVALALVRQSLEVSEAIRADVASLDLRASYVASVRKRRELEISLLMALDRQHPGHGYHRSAFDASEKARARSLLDGLAEARTGIREGVDPQLLERESSLRRSLNARAERLARLGADPARREEGERLERKLDELTTSYRELEAEVRARSPRYAALMHPQPLGLAEVQREVVDGESILLQYFLGESESILWAVTPSRVESHLLPPRGQIESLIREVRGRVTDGGTGLAPAAGHDGDEAWRTPAAELSQVLLGPVADRIRGRRLLVAPDGALHLMPFSALPAPWLGSEGPEAQALLVHDHEIVSLPSASTVALLRGDWRQVRRWLRPVAVFADPVFEADDPRIGARPSSGSSPAPWTAKSPREGGLRSESGGGQVSLPRLLHTRREARSIAALVPEAQLVMDFDASRAAVTGAELSQYRIVHFATHGIAEDDHPELSGIVLSLFDRDGAPQDGFLRLHDIYNLHLPVDLVVLSTCRSALGRSVTGEGLVGLVRGFMYAGSRQVLASLWDVDDEATSQLMSRFYACMFRDGLTPSAALRSAQLELLGRKRWRHPRHWAAFVLQGDWAPDASGDVEQR